MAIDYGEVFAVASSEAIEKAAANFQGMTLKETKANGDTVHTLSFLKNGNTFTYDLLTHAGVASYKGKYLNLEAVKKAFPTGIVDTQFIFTYDEVSTENPNGTGVVSLLVYENNTWQSLKLNQSIPVGKPKKLCRH